MKGNAKHSGELGWTQAFKKKKRNQKAAAAKPHADGLSDQRPMLELIAAACWLWGVGRFV